MSLPRYNNWDNSDFCGNFWTLIVGTSASACYHVINISTIKSSSDLVNGCIYFREVKYQNRLAGPGLMCLESQWRGVRMSAPCQTCPRQKLDAKFKQGSKLNFNKPLTSFLLPLPEKHNAWLDRQGETQGVILQNVATWKYFKDTGMFLFKNDLLWAVRLTQSYRKTYLIVWRYK